MFSMGCCCLQLCLSAPSIAQLEIYKSTEKCAVREIANGGCQDMTSAVKPDDLTSIPRAHRVEAKNCLPKSCLLTSTCQNLALSNHPPN